MGRLKKKYGVKGKPKTNGIKLEMQKDPDGIIDPETEDVRKVPTGNIIATFKTGVKWPDGKPVRVSIYDRKGNDITAAYQAADWAVGEGSTGILHGTASGNNTGGSHKISLYLNAVQLASLVKYEGNRPDLEEIDGEDIDIGV